MRQVAFLRGINVGGHKKVPMADLKKLMEKEGFTNVKTLLASGNVLFDSAAGNDESLRKTIEAAIGKKFGFPVGVIIRSLDEIEKLIAADPFKGIQVTKDTRLYVTFLPAAKKSGLALPHRVPDGSFVILSSTGKDVCSALTLTPGMRTPDSMQILEKEYGKDVTTRNWNTVLKLMR